MVDLEMSDSFVDRDYETIAAGILDLGSTFLGAAEFKKDFYRQAPRFPPHYIYKSAQDHQEFTVNLFGQIACAELGTVMSALGNHNLQGPDGERQPVTDESKVKDVLTLEAPSNAPPIISAMFNNQLGTLNEIRIADEEEEAAAGQMPFVKEFTRPRPDSEDGTTELFNVYMPLKYIGPNQSNRSSPIKRIGKTQLDNTSLLPSDHANGLQVKPNQVVTNAIPTGDDIHIGALYDPKLLSDYGGECFKLVHNKLVQHDVVDINDELIPPWEYYKKLRPGTLILVNATLHCFRFNTTGKRERKLYQIHAQKIQVLATSPLPVEKRKIPTFPSNAHTAYSTTSKPSVSAETKDAGSAFRSFRKRPHDEMAKMEDSEPAAKSSDIKGKKKESEGSAASKVKRRKAAPAVNEDMEVEQ